MPYLFHSVDMEIAGKHGVDVLDGVWCSLESFGKTAMIAVFAKVLDLALVDLVHLSVLCQTRHTHVFALGAVQEVNLDGVASK